MMKRREIRRGSLLGLIGSILGWADRKGGPVPVPTRRCMLSKPMGNVGNPASVLEMGEAQATARMLGLEAPHPKSGERRTSRLRSRRSGSARMHFIFVLTRS